MKKTLDRATKLNTWAKKLQKNPNAVNATALYSELLETSTSLLSALGFFVRAVNVLKDAEELKNPEVSKIYTKYRELIKKGFIDKYNSILKTKEEGWRL